MSNDDDLRDALERLARRGSARGFDAVLAGAADEAARDEAVHHVVERGSGSGDLDPIPFVTAEPAARRRRRPLGSMIAAAGIAALLVVGTLAVSAVVGNSGSGSGSAQAAVERLADALRHGDPLAAAGVLAPEEVRSLQGTVESAERKAAELQLVQTAGAPLAGVNFDVTGLKLSTQPLADGYAKVVVEGGTFSASTRKAQFSPLMQKALHNSHDDSSSADLSHLAADLKLPTFVVGIKRDGKWYVSAAYTVLEYVREANELPAADLGSGTRSVSTLGADTPEAAVQESMRALAQKDWSKLLTMSPPDEVPVYDYRAALVSLIQRDDPRGVDGSKPAFTIGSMTTSAHVDGDSATVSLNASGTTSSGKWSIEGGCFSSTSNDAVAAGDPTLPCYPTAGLFLFLFRFGLGSETGKDGTFTVVKESGRWFVSPVSTVLDLVNSSINGLDQRTLYELLNIPEQLPADAALRLGTKITLPASDPGPRVLSFAGKRGEQLLGLSTPHQDSYDSTPLYVRVFGPDGATLYQADGMFEGQAFTLPVDGTYKFIVTRQFLSAGKVATVTVWDAADAPAAAKDNHGEQCTYDANGSTCNGPSSGGASGSLGVGENLQPGETCTSTANTQSCTSVTVVAPPAQSTGTTFVSGNGASGSSGSPTSVPGTLPEATSVPAGG